MNNTILICFHIYLQLARSSLQPIPTEKRVAITVWRLATGCSYRTIQELFGVGRSTACSIVEEVTTAIDVTLRSTYLRPPNHQETVDIVRGFRDRWSFPQCAGAVDGSHIPIIAPSENRNDYYNRKGWYSVILQAVCDHRYRIWDIDVGWPANGNATQSSASSGKRSHSQSQSSTSPIGQLRLHDVLASKFHPTSSRAIAITKAIGIFISKDMRPYSVVNNAGFKALVQVLEPRYTVPSRTHFADSVIPKL